MPFDVAVALILALAAADRPALAQGRGNGHGRGGPSTGGSITTVTAASVASPSSSRLQFGSWLDDASLLEPGEASAAVSVGYFRTSGGSQTGLPILDGSVGISRRVQLGVSVPIYRQRLPGAPAESSLGDVYAGAKLALIDPSTSTSGFGLAVAPVLEILGTPEPHGTRYSWVVPLSVEFRGDAYRVFASSGVFSRGVIFGSGAIEIPLTRRIVTTCSLSFARSLHADSATLQDVSRNRVDLTGVTAYFLTSSVAVFGGVGRTLGSTPFGSSAMLIGGVSMTVSPPRRR